MGIIRVIIWVIWVINLLTKSPLTLQVASDGKMETTVFLRLYTGCNCQNYGPFSDPYYNTAPNI